MRNLTTELKELRLHGMAGAWVDIEAQQTSINCQQQVKYGPKPAV